MDIYDDWTVLAVFLLIFTIVGAVIASAYVSDRRFTEFSRRCEAVGGTPIKNGGVYFCVEKFADMRPSP